MVEASIESFPLTTGTSSNALKLVSKLMVMYLVAWSFAPVLSIDWSYRILAVLSLAIWLAINIKHIHLKKFDKQAIFFAVCVFFISTIKFGGPIGALRHIHYYLLVVAYFLLLYYRGRENELAGVLVFSLCLFIFFNFRTYFALLLNPHITRAIVRNDEATYQLIRSGVGGYDIVYAQVCVFPLFLKWTLCMMQVSKSKFIIGGLWLFSFCLLLLHAGYAIAIATVLLSTFVLFVYKKKRIVPLIVLLIAGIFSMVLLLAYWTSFHELMLNVFEGTKVAQRIGDIRMAFVEKQAVSSIGSRFLAYSWTLDTIFQYPFIGSLWFAGGGGHSSIGDAFAIFGVIGGICFVKLVFSTITYHRNIAKNNVPLIKTNNATLAATLIVFTLNSSPYDLIFVVIILAHLAFHDIEQRELRTA